MKLTVLASNLKRAVGVTSRSVASRPQLPVLANIKLSVDKRGLQAVSTDLEIGFRVLVGAKVEEEGEITVDAITLGELVKTIPAGKVEIETKREVLKLSANGVRVELPGIGAGEFPSIAKLAGKGQIEMSAEDLKRVVGRVSCSTATDESRPVLTGMLWEIEEEGVVMVSTDGYRLSKDKMKMGRVDKELVGKKMVIPGRALVELGRVVEEGEEKLVGQLLEDKQQVVFEVGDVQLVSRLLSGEFPPYEQIMPEGSEIKVRVGSEELEEAVKRAAIFARDSANIIKFKVDKEGLLVSANSKQVGKSETRVEAEVDGEELEVAFNSRYLLDYFKVVEEDEVVLESLGGLKPGVFKQVDGDDWVQVIMPVRVQK